MIGDQMDTDILGACRFGIDSALVSGGVAELAFHSRQEDGWPTYQLASL
jgi:ribonucleotide monophosphatase NagD (HAD superfamily)